MVWVDGLSLVGAFADATQARMLNDQLIARQSKSIAVQSQELAEQFKDIAEATRTNSTSMKTIAALTMAFLPATFIATVFSTVFFNIEGPDATLQVDTQIWTYIIAQPSRVCDMASLANPGVLWRIQSSMADRAVHLGESVFEDKQLAEEAHDVFRGTHGDAASAFW